MQKIITGLFLCNYGIALDKIILRKLFFMLTKFCTKNEVPGENYPSVGGCHLIGYHHIWVDPFNDSGRLQHMYVCTCTSSYEREEREGKVERGSTRIR